MRKIPNINRRDLEALKSIYDLRCLTFDQIYQLNYNRAINDYTPITQNTCKKKIKEFLDNKLLIEREYELGKTCFFITNKGINLIKEAFNIPENIYDLDKNVIKRGYFTAAELNIKTRLINHQIHLNQFYVDFCSLNIKASWNYVDSKHSELQFGGLIPDAILTILDKTIFIETDMGTENKKQISEKWNNYMSFINSGDFKYRDRDIVVLFIIEGQNLTDRINLVKYLAYEGLMGIIDPSFDIYIGSRGDIIDLLKNKFFPNNNIFNKKAQIDILMRNKFNFLTTSGEKVKNYLNDTEYTWFIRDATNSKIEFVVDEYFYRPMQTLNKIAYLDYNNTYLLKNYNKQIKMIIICDNEQEIYNDLKVIQALDMNNVYCTTLNRLINSRYLYESLFQFDFLGNIFVFEDENLSKRKFEKNMKLY